jgi:two-component system response regulator AtoC
VIAATNRDLRAAMKEGRFREDLFYRLHVIPIQVPPLRERKDDIPLLVDHILKGLRRRGLERARAVSPEAMRYLIAYGWPGNVRELENVLERGAVVARGAVITEVDLPDELRVVVPPRPSAQPSPGSGVPKTVEGGQAELLAVLATHHWNRNETATALGVDRTTLWRRMKRLGLA